MHKITVDIHWFELIAAGIKTIEGRLANPKFGVDKWQIGDTILINISTRNLYNPTASELVINTNKSMIATITSMKKYPNLADYLNNHLYEALPGIETVEEGIKIYRKYIGPESEIKYGIWAISLDKIHDQV